MITPTAEALEEAAVSVMKERRATRTDAAMWLAMSRSEGMKEIAMLIAEDPITPCNPQLAHVWTAILIGIAIGRELEKERTS